MVRKSVGWKWWTPAAGGVGRMLGMFSVLGGENPTLNLMEVIVSRRCESITLYER